MAWGSDAHNIPHYEEVAMPKDHSLLAHLVPKLTSQVENAATDALGYILNNSDSAMRALNELLAEATTAIEPVTRVDTQVTYEDGSRPDMAGYDADGVKRLLVEAKFWASLLEGQASGYAKQFEHSGPAVLLFIAPGVRIPTLWTEVRRQIAGSELGYEDSTGRMPRLTLSGKDIHLMAVSWIGLLDRMANIVADESVTSDIRQLRGLAQMQDERAFLPMRSEELGPEFARRMAGFRQLIDDTVYARGMPEGWISERNSFATAQVYGPGRYFSFEGSESRPWFGVNTSLWSSDGDTPLWLWLGDDAAAVARAQRVAAGLGVKNSAGWVPIYLKTGVEYELVLDDVAFTLRSIGEILGMDALTERSSTD